MERPGTTGAYYCPEGPERTAILILPIIVNELNSLGNYERSSEDKNTINGSLNGIRISFFTYSYKMSLDE